MDKKELILQELKALGFDLELVEGNWWHLEYEDSHILYMPSEDDEDFLRLAIPAIFEVTEENRFFVLEIANTMNLNLKYLKVVVVNDSLWLFIECRLIDGQQVDDILELSIRMLHYSKKYFCKVINGDDETTLKKENSSYDEEDDNQ